MRWPALLLLMVLAACSRPVPEAAERRQPGIVSLNPCSDAILAEVADPAQILGLSHFSSDPASSSMDVATARRFRSISGSAEEVLALKPDVIVADQFVPAATRAAFARMGLRLVQLPIVSGVDEAKRQVAELARLVGHPERGRAMNARIDAALAAAAPDGGAPIPAVVWQAGGIVPGSDTLITDLLRRTGFVSQSAQRGMRQADYLPLETMLADPPRVILVAGNARSQENRMLSHPALAHLRATRRAAFDASLLWCGGPTIERAARRLAEIRRSMDARRRASPREGGDLDRLGAALDLQEVPAFAGNLPRSAGRGARFSGGPRLRGDSVMRRDVPIRYVMR